jgi:predicted FMN-binding regulatory protein PaiB
MYIPSSFAGPQSRAALGFLRANPFATLITGTVDTPHISHVPLLAEDPLAPQLVLLGHLARQPACEVARRRAHPRSAPAPG